MYEPPTSRPIDSVADRSLAETVAIAIGTSVLLATGSIAALAAAALVGPNAVLAFVVAVAVGIGTMAGGIAAANRTGGWLATVVERRRSPPCARPPC